MILKTDSFHQIESFSLHIVAFDFLCSILWFMKFIHYHPSRAESNTLCLLIANLINCFQLSGLQTRILVVFLYIVLEDGHMWFMESVGSALTNSSQQHVHTGTHPAPLCTVPAAPHHCQCIFGVVLSL